MESTLSPQQPKVRSLRTAGSAYAGWRTSMAIRPDQFRAAEDLVRRRYAWRGYHVTRDFRSSGGQVTLLAESEGRLIGTLSVRPDSSHGLLAEATYADEIERMRGEGHRLG